MQTGKISLDAAIDEEFRNDFAQGKGEMSLDDAINEEFRSNFAQDGKTPTVKVSLDSAIDEEFSPKATPSETWRGSLSGAGGFRGDMEAPAIKPRQEVPSKGNGGYSAKEMFLGTATNPSLRQSGVPSLIAGEKSSLSPQELSRSLLDQANAISNVEPTQEEQKESLLKKEILADELNKERSIMGRAAASGMGRQMGDVGYLANLLGASGLGDALQSESSRLGENNPFTRPEEGWQKYAVSVAENLPFMAATMAGGVGAGALTSSAAAKLGAGKALSTLAGLGAAGATRTAIEGAIEAGGAAGEASEMGMSKDEQRRVAGEVFGADFLKQTGLNAIEQVLELGGGSLKGLAPIAKLLGSKSGKALGVLGAGAIRGELEGLEEKMQEESVLDALGIDRDSPEGKARVAEARHMGRAMGWMFEATGLSLNGLTKVGDRMIDLGNKSRKETPSDQKQAYEDIISKVESGNLTAEELIPYLTATQKLGLASDAIQDLKDLRLRKRQGEELNEEEQSRLANLTEAIGLLSSEGEDAAISKMSEVFDVPEWVRSHMETETSPYMGTETGEVYVDSDQTAVVPRRNETAPVTRGEAPSSLVPAGPARRPLADMTLENTTEYTPEEIEANREPLRRLLGKVTKKDLRERFGIASDRNTKKGNLVDRVIDKFKADSQQRMNEMEPRDHKAIPMGGADQRSDTIIEQPSQRLPMLTAGPTTPSKRRAVAETPTQGAIVAEGEGDPYYGEVEIDARPGTERRAYRDRLKQHYVEKSQGVEIPVPGGGGGDAPPYPNPRHAETVADLSTEESRIPLREEQGSSAPIEEDQPPSTPPMVKNESRQNSVEELEPYDDSGYNLLPRPERNDFDTDEDYEAALSEWEDESSAEEISPKRSVETGESFSPGSPVVDSGTREGGVQDVPTGESEKPDEPDDGKSDGDVDSGHDRRGRSGRLVTSREQFVPDVDESTVPGDIQRTLRPHQIQGSAMMLRAMEKFGGGILADGTGAGKTRQILAVAETISRSGRPVVIIAPSGVIKPQWSKGVFSGSYVNDGKDMNVSPNLYQSGPISEGIHLSTYERLSDILSNLPKNASVIFDEAHYLKNAGSGTKRALRGLDIAKKAQSVLFVTATPADKVLQIEYLQKADVFEGRTKAEQFTALGLRKEERRIKGRSIVQWVVPSGKGPTVMNNLNKLFARLTQRGIFLKRELSLSDENGGVQIFFDDVKLSDEGKHALADVQRTLGDPETASGLEKARILMTLRRRQEPYKVEPAIKLAKEAFAKGHKVVFFVSRVNDSTLSEGNESDTSISPITVLKEELSKIGLRRDEIAEIHGNISKPKQLRNMESFQNGNAKAVIATMESGGTGINLDDTVGNSPRTMIILTAPFSAVENVQAIGRVWRLNTKSYPEIHYLTADTNVDQWNMGLIQGKMKSLNAVVRGEVKNMMGVDEEKVDSELDSTYDPRKDNAKREIERKQDSEAPKFFDVTGNTFPAREALKRLGGRWNPEKKAWRVPGARQKDLEQIIEKHSGLTAKGVSGESKYQVQDKREAETGTELYQVAPAGTKDAEYEKAIREGDIETAQGIINEAARAAGYGSDVDHRMQHQAPNREDFNLAMIRETGLVPEDYWSHPEWYLSSKEEQESFRVVLSALRQDEAKKDGLTTITVYRAVPKGVKEGSFRNGDWVTPSRAYAGLEGANIPGGYRIIQGEVPLENLWWDGNSIAEIGYDDGKTYAYKNTKNNRKRLDLIVYDEDGNIVPPSKRFKPRKAETFYQATHRKEFSPITIASVESSFPGATVTEQDGGSFVVETPNGQRITVHPDATITMNKKSASEAYGREMNESDEAVGSFQSVNGEGVIRLTEKADQGTLDHETWHAAKAFAISEEDAAVLKKDYANEEQEAEAYRQWVAGRRMKTTKRSGRIFQKILDFFSRIRANLFGKNSEDVFREVATGEVWSKEEIKNFEDGNLIYSLIQKYNPKRTIKAYKLFRTKKNSPGDLFPLFIGKTKPTAVNQWIEAEFLPTKGFAARPGWHAGVLPVAPHLRQSSTGKIAPDRVWAEVEIPADEDWQPMADESSTRDIRDRVPKDGHYRFKTNKMQGGAWIIGGAIKINKILSDAKVSLVLSEAGYSQEEIDAEMHESQDVFENFPSSTQEQYSVKDPGDSKTWQPVVDKMEGERVVRPTKEKKTIGERLKEGTEAVYDGYIDELLPLARAFGDKVYNLARVSLRGTSGPARQMIERGSVDGKTKGLYKIFESLPKGEADGFMHYSTYKHLLDVAENSESARESQIELGKMAAQATKEASAMERRAAKEPKGSPDFKALQAQAKEARERAQALEKQAKNLESQIKKTVLKSTTYKWGIAELEKAYPHWRKAQQDLAQYSKEILGVLNDAGIISDKLKDELNRRYPNYVPLQRDFGDEEAVNAFIRTKGLVNLGSPIKKLKGSDRDVIDPVRQIIENTFRAYVLKGQNDVAREIVKQVDEGAIPDEVIKPTEDRYHGPTEHVFYVWENGEKRLFKTDADIYNALMMTGSRHPGVKETIFETMAKYPTKAIRIGATRTVGFALRNMFRDNVHAGAISENGFVPFYDGARGMFHVLTKSDLYDEFLRSGGAMGTINAVDRNYFQEEYDKIRALDLNHPTVKNMSKKAWRFLSDIAEASENATRVGEYMRAKGRGKSVKDAALSARDLQDFERGGGHSKSINSFSAFFNAGLQGMDKLIRAHGFPDMMKAFHETEGGIKATKAALEAFRWKTAVRATMYLALPSVLTAMFNLADDDRKKAYLELPAWRRDLFWNIVLDPGNPDTGDKGFVLSLPKPFELGVLYGSIPERFTVWLHGKDKKAFDGMGESLGSTFPSVLPNFLVIPLELATNRSLFLGRNIVPQSEQKLSPGRQSGPYTSEFAKWAGKTFDVSPRKIDYTLRSTFSSLGGAVLKASDSVIQDLRGDPRPEIPAKEKYSFGFVNRGYKSPQSVQDFYDGLDDLEAMVNDAKDKAKNKEPLSLQDKKSLAMGGQLTALRRSRTQMGELFRKKASIAEKEGLSGERKRELIDSIDAMVLRIATAGTKRIDKIHSLMGEGGKE